MSGDAEGLLTVRKQDLVVDPYPHLFKKPFIRPDFFARLKAEFPADDLFDRNSSVGGRAGRDLYPGDRLYDEFLASSKPWREFADYIDSPAYVDLVLDLFGPHLAEYGCLADPSRIRYQHWIESREELAEGTSRISRIAFRVRNALGLHRDRHLDPNDVFVRMDLAQAAVGYGKSIHCDRPNRLISMLIYFSDKDDIGMQGGDLRVHRHKERKPMERYERHPRDSVTEVVAEIEPAENLGGMFIGCNNSYHSATEILRTRGYRDFVYTSVASRSHRLWRS